MKARKARGNFLLLLTAMIWGSSFVAQSAGADLISPAFFNGTRMLLGSLLLSPLAVYRMRRYVAASSRRTLLLGGACCGVLMFTGSYIQQTGIAYTTAGKAGFLTAIYVVLVPVLGIFLKKKPRPILWVSVALACVGLYFLCFTDKTFSLAMGDAAMLGGAVMFALHIMVVDHFSPLVDGVCLSFVQFLTAGSLGMVVAFITEQPSFAALSAAAVPILYTGVFTMGVAYTLQIVAQKDTDPTVASLILCMESVFAVVFGWLILHETLSLREGVGSVFMFVAILLAQLA